MGKGTGKDKAARLDSQNMGVIEEFCQALKLQNCLLKYRWMGQKRGYISEKDSGLRKIGDSG
jgi:hypothetical protein